MSWTHWSSWSVTVYRVSCLGVAVVVGVAREAMRILWWRVGWSVDGAFESAAPLNLLLVVMLEEYVLVVSVVALCCVARFAG